ncbi:hypothetical protein SKAU_G00341970 [Synaphobranchus kaupii]|uniref:Uncharacterized protein n=1 Tax=Synaphobranchus kaupii TaxID=118154 RepID=A0A9Q1EN65_SYNKA|nr:hypothetical protein SKAU_G00341970 [Synaphobranchus kaupii]
MSLHDNATVEVRGIETVLNFYINFNILKELAEIPKERASRSEAVLKRVLSAVRVDLLHRDDDTTQDLREQLELLAAANSPHTLDSGHRARQNRHNFTPSRCKPIYSFPQPSLSAEPAELR